MENLNKIGRWKITNNGISTLKENNAVIEFDISEIWSFKKKNNIYVYELPVFLCSKPWISNLDLLDFNSAFLISQEFFEEFKPIDFTKISWIETLKLQYNRINKSLDINSFEGRKQFQFEKEFRESLTLQEIIKTSRIKSTTNLSNERDVFGDKYSRKH